MPSLQQKLGSTLLGMATAGALGSVLVLTDPFEATLEGTYAENAHISDMQRVAMLQPTPSIPAAPTIVAAPPEIPLPPVIALPEQEDADAILAQEEAADRFAEKLAKGTIPFGRTEDELEEDNPELAAWGGGDSAPYQGLAASLVYAGAAQTLSSAQFAAPAGTVAPAMRRQFGPSRSPSPGRQLWDVPGPRPGQNMRADLFAAQPGGPAGERPLDNLRVTPLLLLEELIASAMPDFGVPLMSYLGQNVDRLSTALALRPDIQDDRSLYILPATQFSEDGTSVFLYHGDARTVERIEVNLAGDLEAGGETLAQALSRLLSAKFGEPGDPETNEDGLEVFTYQATTPIVRTVTYDSGMVVLEVIGQPESRFAPGAPAVAQSGI